jgi:methylenetetrahydrofolate reductase (NADPH)
VRAGSRLEVLTGRGEFVVTAEVNPPAAADPSRLRETARAVAGCADAYNVTENNRALVKMASWAASVVLVQEGLEPVMQVVTRDRNRMALQADILGASALGVRNVLCLKGDPPSAGNEKEAKAVDDVTPEQMLSMFRQLRDEGRLMGGDEVEVRPKLFLGGTSNPFGGDYKIGAEVLAKRVEAGADFVQTQAIYDVAAFEKFMDEVRARGLHGRVAIIGGVIPLKSGKMARYMREKVPGIIIPESIMERMEGTNNPEVEGVKVTLEILEDLRKVRGLAGVHIMPVGWEKKLRAIVEGAGLMPRPAPV